MVLIEVIVVAAVDMEVEVMIVGAAIVIELIVEEAVEIVSI